MKIFKDENFNQIFLHEILMKIFDGIEKPYGCSILLKTTTLVTYFIKTSHTFHMSQVIKKIKGKN